MSFAHLSPWAFLGLVLVIIAVIYGIWYTDRRRRVSERMKESDLGAAIDRIINPPKRRGD